MRSCFRLAEQMRATVRAEAPVHDIAAVRNAAEVSRAALQCQGCGWKADIHRAAAGTDVLADPTPADSREDRACRECIPDGSAQTAAFDIHGRTITVVAARK